MEYTQLLTIHVLMWHTVHKILITKYPPHTHVYANYTKEGNVPYMHAAVLWYSREVAHLCIIWLQHGPAKSTILL